ncbi:MAG: hypothetical protein K0A98_03855 [Trueperaceae bacterium]|nr:hypothetical protein [Trueperaceae bacterium]
MNARTRRLALSALLALALAASAWAQEEDAFVQRYGLAIENLRLAVAAMPADNVTARESVDRAFASLLTLSRDAAGSSLVTGMQRVFDRARTAIANGSRDDLAVQAAVLEGAFQRLLYDAALRAAVDGDLPLARERLVRIADDVGFAPIDREPLANPEQPTATLRYLVEVGVADVITTHLAAAEELAATDLGGAYRSFARAYGAFLLVQDSPRTVATLNQEFVGAAVALVGGQLESFDAALESVGSEIVAMGTAARERRASVPGGGTALSPQPIVLPGVEDVTEAPEPAEGAPEDADPATPLAAILAAEAGDAPAIDVAALIFELEEAARRERLDALEGELAAVGMPFATRTEHAELLLDAGLETVEAMLSAVTGHATTVVAAAHVGDDARAHAAIDALANAYEAWLSPVVRPSDLRVDDVTQNLLRHLGGVSPVRAQDAVVLAGQIDAAGAVLGDAATPALQRGAAETTAVWAGTLRDAVTLALGLLALIPLFLLNLAFGGGNRNWQAIGVALFLLWLPALFEGVIGLGGLLHSYAAIDTLLPLAAYSVFGNVVAQTVWAALTLLAVAFAIAGLSGISRQFGLLGGRRSSRAASRPGERPAGSVRHTESTARTVDWDDEA